MTPQKKAEELVDQMYYQIFDQRTINPWYKAKKCALIAVDNIINNFGSLTDGKSHYCDYAAIKYYEEVKQEIENL
jgi:hypothetical protein